MAAIIVEASSAGGDPSRKATTGKTAANGPMRNGVVVTGAWTAAKAASDTDMADVAAAWEADVLAGASEEALAAISAAKTSHAAAS
ncbi:hypothetical protein GCM10007866_11380 [Gluconobacter albidus]|uniref:Uncharacterized protein n=1 Tax=Gluconobacter albidus TaxID=318683 RepID=A0ABQ5X095_9PROT|nr:hypothetical protein AA3250_0773 [Gluconobacter albidus NBRC 3250]GLQ68687.1 hypothetical protein GCM10007866_11380 [Gluconobacter albidus]